MALAAFGLLHLSGAGISQADAQLRVVRVDEVPGIEGTYPSWAPDGERLAFERGGDLYIVERDGSNERRFVHDPALDETPVGVSKQGGRQLFQPVRLDTPRRQRAGANHGRSGG